MNKTLQKRQNELIKKQEILNRARVVLKSEFIGIDNVIDEVTEALSSWYMFPDMQEKPVIINLWGLTGVGKTSLVDRLAQLLEFENKYFRFDLGEKYTQNHSIKSRLADMYENASGHPAILAFDEFQHARTLDESGSELDGNSSRIIWQLLDSGKFQVSRFTFCLEEIYDLIHKLRYMMRNGVKVSKGKVISRTDYFIEQMDLKCDLDNFDPPEADNAVSDVHFVPSKFLDTIHSLVREKFFTTYELKAKLDELNGYETVKFLQDIFSVGSSPKTVDCSKGLIFVLGNLDEAYRMSHDFNPDMDADEFHEQSLKINVPVIKRALKTRFRNEQIARLGNIHIIYPALSKTTYKKIIALELSKVAEKVEKQQKIRFTFDESVHDLIYKEGVYPTQGTRPVFTTIQQVIKSRLGKVITEVILRNLTVSKITFSAEADSVFLQYLNGENIVYSFKIRQQFALENLRKNKRDDVQAITAVHEAGHAIISAILMRTIPEMIVSTTAEAGNDGFVFTKFRWNYVSRKEITRRLALYLAGYAAEKVVFGEENVTTGAEEDIEKATSFITHMLKQCGMGKQIGSFHAQHPGTREYLNDLNGKLNKEAGKWLQSALDLAEETLKEQEILLLNMAGYLSDNRQMNKQQIAEMIKNHAYGFDMDSLIENGDLLFYRDHLKKKIAGLATSSDRIPSRDSCEFSLNNKRAR